MSAVPWHPFLVHIPIGGWLLGTVLIWVGLIRSRRDWDHAAWFCLALAALASLPAVLSGQADLAHYEGPIYKEIERHRVMGNLLPWLMCGLVLFRFHLTFKKKGFQPPVWLLPVLASLVAILIIYTGLLGGKLVYILGVAEAILGTKKS